MSNIVVDPKINRGVPSIRAANGGHCTVKQVFVLHRDGVEKGMLSMKELVEEVGLSQAQVFECIEYVKLYPQVLT
jgi:uncharacterized protein (DUF433 family)